MKSSPRTCLFLIFVLLLSANSTFAQLDTIPATTQKAFLINSSILNEPRSIWVSLPSSYGSGDQSYPVIYVLDGDGHFKYVAEMVNYLSGYDRNRIPEMIVVGIPNVDRGRDLTPVFTDNQESSISTTTGAGKFLQFIQNELVPYIDKTYKTAPYRILAGHSLGGLFTLYAKETAPALFQSVILISPAIRGVKDKLLTGFTPFLKDHPQLSGKIFVTIGNENTQCVDLLMQQLKQSAPPSLKWEFRKYEDENHFSVTYKSMFDALKFIYASWFIDFYGTARLSYKDIDQHFARLSREFGYTINPTEDFVNNCGYTQLRIGNIDGAIDIFKENIRNHPNSFNVYDSMGEAYMKKGQKELAIINYEKSVSLNPNNDNGKEMLKNLKNEK